MTEGYVPTAIMQGKVDVVNFSGASSGTFATDDLVITGEMSARTGRKTTIIRF